MTFLLRSWCWVLFLVLLDSSIIFQALSQLPFTPLSYKAVQPFWINDFERYIKIFPLSVPCLFFTSILPLDEINFFSLMKLSHWLLLYMHLLCFFGFLKKKRFHQGIIKKEKSFCKWMDFITNSVYDSFKIIWNNKWGKSKNHIFLLWIF